MKTNKSLLVSIFGFPATLIHGDTLVLDRWLWLKRRLPVTNEQLKLLDVGCGTGAFTIGAAHRGYNAIGLSWDERNQIMARERAAMCNAEAAEFEILDVRNLDERKDLTNQFDVVLCLENIEHIMNDSKLMQDMAACLKPGGRLLLTTPNFDYKAITPEDNGPFSTFEDGWHVRRGYRENDLADLCCKAKLQVKEFSYCSGFVSQKVTFVLRTISMIHPLLGWACVLPLRVLPPLLDPLLSKITPYPGYSICLEAYKPLAVASQAVDGAEASA